MHHLTTGRCEHTLAHHLDLARTSQKVRIRENQGGGRARNTTAVACPRPSQPLDKGTFCVEELQALSTPC